MKYIDTVRHITFIAFLFTACDLEIEDASGFEYKKIFSINDSTLMSPHKLLVDEKENIYVLDGGNHKLIKFDHKGAKLWEFGRKGSGPGEFVSATSMSIEDSLIYIQDILLRRVTTVSIDGEMKNLYKLDSKLDMPTDFQFVNESIFVGGIYFNNNKEEDWFRLSKFNKSVHIGDVYNKNAKSPLWREPYIKFLVNKNEEFYVYDSNCRQYYFIEKYNPEGIKLAEIKRNIKPVRFTEKEIKEMEEKKKNSPLAGLFSSRKEKHQHKRMTWRLFSDLQNRLYVKTPIKGGWVLDVFDSDNTFLKRIPIHIEDNAIISNGFLYQYEENDLGYSISKYKFKF